MGRRFGTGRTVRASSPLRNGPPFHYAPRHFAAFAQAAFARARPDREHSREVLRVLSQLWNAKLGNSFHMHQVRLSTEGGRCTEVQGHDADEPAAGGSSAGVAGTAWSAACRRWTSAGARWNRRGRAAGRAWSPRGPAACTSAASDLRQRSGSSPRVRRPPARRVRCSAGSPHAGRRLRWSSPGRSVLRRSRGGAFPRWVLASRPGTQPGQSARRHDGDRCERAWIRRACGRRASAGCFSSTHRRPAGRWFRCSTARRIRRAA
jgi:hypothetical protein